MKQAEVIIIGAGVIGLAIAKILAEQGKEVLVLEANQAIGLEGSYRNSAVMHAGIYYPKDSFKAALCVAGRKELLTYCQEKNISHQLCGKLIVAVDKTQATQLDKLFQQAQQNGVSNLSWLTQAEIKNMSPHISGQAALYSPDTGIIAGKQLLASYLNDAEKCGANIYCGKKVTGGEANANQFTLHINDGSEIYQSRYLINSAGLWAPEVAAHVQGIPTESIPRSYYAKGNYFAYTGQIPFKQLIYPLPNTAGLGIHATVDLEGQVRFGPDVEWVEHLNYDVALDRRKIFFQAIQSYFPEIQENELVPVFAGIRPKIKPAEQQPQDFLMQTEANHGIKGLVNLYGMESPGLTASLAIADYVAKKIF